MEGGTVHSFNKELGSGPRSESCLFFQGFHYSKLLNGCLLVWPNKQVLSVFQWFFSIYHWHAVCIPLVKDQ